MALSNFLQKHLKLLSLEREEEIAQGLSLASTNLGNVKELENKGICISKLQIESQRIGLFGRHIINFISSRRFGKSLLPSHSITTGDIVGVFNNGHSLLPQQSLSGVVVKSSDNGVGVAFEEIPEELNLEQYGDSLQLVKLANDVTYKRMKRALDDLISNKNTSHLTNVLLQLSPLAPPLPKWTHLLDDSDQFTFINTSLDTSQQRAVLFALSRPDLAIIHGPPGTGKTTTVIEYILQSVKLNKKILACAPSNIAVDNLVERLSLHKGIKLVRLGHPARLEAAVIKYSLDSILNSIDGAQIILDVRKEMSTAWSKVGGAKSSAERRKWQTEAKLLKKELISREEKLIKEILKSADVILSTNTGAGLTGPLKHLASDHFDVVVIDECAQSLEANCWIPITKATTCLLAGDHKQLPPTILSEKAASDGLAVSLMERLVTIYGDQVTSLLTTQYRMNYDIMKWPSQYLYEDTLIAHTSVSSHLLKDLPSVTISTATESSLFFIDTAGCGLYEREEEEEGSKGNEGETDLVLAHVNELLQCGVSTNDIAIIAPYNLQVELIRQKLSSSTLLSASKPIEVHTVDGFQGREKEAVVISFTRSNKKGEVGFLKEVRRTNVAVTRARRHLALIGDSLTLSHEPFIKGLIDYCTEHGEVHSAHEYMEYNVTEINVDSNEVKSKVDQPSQLLKDKRTQKDAGPNVAIQQQRLLYEEKLKDFISSSNENISFPTSLSSSVRKIIHELSEELGLIHVSHGEGRDRYIVVSKSKLESTVNTTTTVNSATVEDTDNEPIVVYNSKKNTFAVLDNDDEHIVVECSDTTVDSTVVSTLVSEPDKESSVLAATSTTPKPAQSTPVNIKSATTGIWQCSICGYKLPEMNKELHLVHCEKRKQESMKKKETPRAKNPATQKKKKHKSPVMVADSDDIDSLLAEMTIHDKTCNFTDCKKPANHLGIKCPFCHRKYCMTHNIAEVHGCGEEAKRVARQDYQRHMRSDDKKRVDPSKRAHLQRKLDKKINDLSSDRQRKKPSSS